MFREQTLDALDHEDSDHHQGGTSRDCRDAGDERGEEDAKEVAEGDHQGRQSRAAALVHTRHRFAVRRDRAGAHQSAEECADRVGHEGGVAALEVVGLLWVDEPGQVRRSVQEHCGADEVEEEKRDERPPEVEASQTTPTGPHTPSPRNFCHALAPLLPCFIAGTAVRASITVGRPCEDVDRSTTPGPR